MAFEYDTVAWQDWDGVIHREIPTNVDASEAQALIVHYFDPDTGQEEWHTVRIYAPPLDNWDDWDELIADQMEQYGYPAA